MLKNKKKYLNKHYTHVVIRLIGCYSGRRRLLTVIVGFFVVGRGFFHLGDADYSQLAAVVIAFWTHLDLKRNRSVEFFALVCRSRSSGHARSDQIR